MPLLGAPPSGQKTAPALTGNTRPSGATGAELQRRETGAGETHPLIPLSVVISEKFCLELKLVTIKLQEKEAQILSWR